MARLTSRCADDLGAVRRLAMAHDAALEHLLDAQCAEHIRPVSPALRDAENASWMALQGAAYRLRTAAGELQALCRGPVDEDLAHWCHGCVTLAGEVARGITAEPARELDFDRLGAILDGLNQLARRIGASGAAVARYCTDQHRVDVAGWRAAGRSELADRLEHDPDIRAAVAALDAVAGQHGRAAKLF
jgi:hypothetical protein